MAAIVIPNHTNFGAMTNQIVARLGSLNSMIERLNDAIGTASSGIKGDIGTQFEASAGALAGPSQNNNFGIVPDPDLPGKSGQDYAYAVGRLHQEWATFWAAAEPFIAALDNGTPG